MEKLSDNKFRTEISKIFVHKEVIKWHNKLKGVRFKVFNDVKYIPSRDQIENPEEIWWSFEDINNFKRNYYLCLQVQQSF
tara:strand:- start:210 stop:449 length:240 start_codon:yes stop_codon:yes gene_type:complete